MNIRKALGLAALAVGFAGLSSPALAIVCDDTPDTDERFIVVTSTGAPVGTIACYADGLGNPTDDYFGGSPPLIEKDEDSNLTGLMQVTGMPNGDGGTWWINPELWNVNSQIFMLFKFGGGGTDGGDDDPDWWMVQLTDGAYAGAWDWFSGKETGLSHVSLYAERSVPEPGTLALMGLGLAGLGFGLRRRKNA